MLAKLTEKSQKDWDERVPDVLAAYNSSIHASTHYSPNFMVFGRENRAPLDLVMGIPKSEEEYFGSVDPWVYKQQKIQQEAYELARENLKCHAERNKDFYDVKVKTAKFEVGQWVYVYTPRRRQNLSPKWMMNYEGPMLIVQKMGPVNVRVQRSPRSKSQIVHIDKIKKVLGPTPRSWLKQEPNDGVVEGGGEAARAQQDDALDLDPLEDQADLPSEVGQESIPNAAPETVPPRVSVDVGRPPVSNQTPNTNPG